MGSIREQFVFRRGDANGVVQLFFDNLATLLAVIFFLGITLRGFQLSVPSAALREFPQELASLDGKINEIIFQRCIPGLGVTMVFGNLYYSFMGARLGAKENRMGDVTALPYGINTPGAFAFLFSIIGPVAISYLFSHSLSDGSGCLVGPDGKFWGVNIDITDATIAAEFRKCWESAAEAAWRAGVVSNFVAGLVSILLGLAGNQVLKVTPTVALLTSLAGIGFVFLGFVQISQSYTEPLAGLLPLYVMIAAYFADVDFGPVPKSLVVAAVGCVLGWADGVKTGADVQASVANVKAWGLSTGFSALGDWEQVGDYLGTTLPVAVAAAAGTLMNVISARKAGDKYGVRETMVSDGFGTLIGALFGTPFGTSVYIGHPAYKKMGAGIMYSVLNCVIFFLCSLFGIFALISAIVPQLAVSPLILFVGLMICQEALREAKVRHFPAFIIGLMPSVQDWASVSGLSYGAVGGVQYFGFLSMGKSALLLALVSTTMTVFITDRRFLAATAWTLFAAGLSAFGFLHQDSAAVSKAAFENGSWLEPQSMYCVAEADVKQVNNTCPTGYSPCFTGKGEAGCAFDATTKLRFMGGYLLVATFLALLAVLQHRGLVRPAEQDDSLMLDSSKEVDDGKVAGDGSGEEP